MIGKIKSIIKPYYNKINQKKVFKNYIKKYFKYSFVDCKCVDYEQYEASIIRLYHTIEKGLSYEDYRAGFGKENVEKLVVSLEQYCSNGFDTSAFFYETALSCLYAYIQKNKEHGHVNYELESRIKKLPGKANEFGGTILVSAPNNPDSLTYAQLVTCRHSIRHFSDKPVDIQLLRQAIELAQHAPSACNRQGWKTRIVNDKEMIKTILANQNGNRGFGHEFDKILVVTADLRAQQRNRELFQAFIDGGMYAESVINSLYYYGIGSVPLSAALTAEQEKIVRSVIRMDDAEVFIIFIGIGNYPDGEFLTTRSERKAASPVLVR